MRIDIGGEPFVEIYVDKVLKETYPESIVYGAILVEIDEKTEWIPKVNMEDWPNVEEEGEVLVKEWFAIKKGLV